MMSRKPSFLLIFLNYEVLNRKKNEYDLFWDIMIVRLFGKLFGRQNLKVKISIVGEVPKTHFCCLQPVTSRLAQTNLHKNFLQTFFASKILLETLSVKNLFYFFCIYCFFEQLRCK